VPEVRIERTSSRLQLDAKTTSATQAFYLVCRVGIEPTQYGLRVRCSTAELPAHYLEDTLQLESNQPNPLSYIVPGSLASARLCYFPRSPI
jgi:hypothetical protein